MKISASALILVLVLAACHGKKITGPKRNLGGVGFLQTYAVVDDEDQILELGVELEKDLMELELMPTEASDGKNDIVDPETGEVVWYCCGHEAEIRFPVGNSIDHPFDHFVANWNPEGHAGPNYAVPHWDFHFYTMTKQERESVKAPDLYDVCPPIGGAFIPVTCPDYFHQNHPIPCDEQPPAHILPGPPGLEGIAVEPQMGSHMLDLNGPELGGADFTHTWIFGIQGGHLAFWEPMVTTAFLKSLESGDILFTGDANGGTVSELPDGGVKVVVPVDRPVAAPVAGRYPTTYTMLYDATSETYRVALTDMEYLPASTGVC